MTLFLLASFFLSVLTYGAWYRYDPNKRLIPLVLGVVTWVLFGVAMLLN